MEVTHVKDHVTHAVITGQSLQAESFGISDDPAFFHVLSSTLYRDKLRAVVRETLCNGWDAHIEAGLTSIPLEVFLTGSKLTIQDFGMGIHRNLIKPIYGIYGASTKKANLMVTGGFGLGCKAPFSYVDHFEVISCHEGEKTVYRMSKSSGAVMGKPSIQPILTVPTDETGITVSLAVKSETDKEKIKRLIHEIVNLGGMQVKLNGELLPSIPFENAKHGYIMVKAEEFGEGSEHSIQVRYGHVVYPIEKNDAYSSEYSNVRKFIQRVARGKKHNYYDDTRAAGWVLILQAEPNTISVTPSRESLSMTEHTIETVQTLLSNFLKTTAKQDEIEPICVDLLKTAISKSFLNQKPSDLMTTSKEIPNQQCIQEHISEYIVDSYTAGGHYFLRQYPDFKRFHKKDIFLRLNALIQFNFGRRGTIQSYRNAMLRSYGKERAKTYNKFTSDQYRRELYRGFDASAYDWYHRKFCKPIIMAMQGNKLVDHKRLWVWASRQNVRGYQELGTIPFMEYGHSFGSYLPLLRGFVIVAYNRIAIEDRADVSPALKHWFGKAKDSLVYLAPRTGDRAKAAVELFQKLGFYVLDLTQRQKWEPEIISVAPIPKVAPAYKRPKGYPLLSNLSSSMSVSTLYNEDSIRTEKPEFHAIITPKGQGECYGLKLDQMVRVVQLWGDKGVAVKSVTQAARIAKMSGSEEAFPWVRKKLLEAYKNDPQIKQYHENTAHIDDHPDAKLDYQEEAYLRMVENDTILRGQLNLPADLPDHVRMMVYIYRGFDRWDFDRYPELKEMQKLVKSWGVHPELKKLVDQIKKSKTLRIVDSNGMVAALSGGSNLTPAEKSAVRNMFLTALRG